MQEDWEDSPTEDLNWQKYAGIARRRMLLFSVALLVVWAAAWGAGWILPSIYRSGTLILVEQPTVPQQFVVPNIAGNLQDRLDSITQQILSRTRLLHIVDSLNLYPELRQRKTPDEIVERMRKDIEIELVRSQGHDELSSFNIYYSSKDPQVAQRVTSELTNLFISENLEERQQQSQSTTEFLSSQLEDARQTLAEQEEKVREFKDRHLGELPGQLQSNLQILGGLQNQLQSEEDALDRAQQQNVYLDSLLSQYQAIERNGKAGDAPVGLPALDQELDRLKAQLAELRSHYTDRHPDVRKVKDQIAQDEKLKQQIEADLNAKGGPSESPAPRTETEINNAAPMAQLQSQLKANQTEIASRQRTIQELKAKIADYQVRLNQAPVMEQQLADLTRGYEQSRAHYDSLLAKKNDSEMATDLERRQQGEHFRILDPPSLPQKPYSPNRVKLSGMGLGLGVVLGLLLCAGAEFLDDRVYGEEQLRKLIPLNVLCEVPNINTAREVKSRQWRWRLECGFAGLVVVCIAAGSAFSYLLG